MDEQVSKILTMLVQRDITVDEALELLQALTTLYQSK